MLLQEGGILRLSLRLINLFVLTGTLFVSIASAQKSGGNGSKGDAENKATENKPQQPKAAEIKRKGKSVVTRLEIDGAVLVAPDPVVVESKEDRELTILLYPCKGETPGNVLGISKELQVPDRVTGFLRKLGDTDLKTRACAARQLGYLGSGAKDAVPQLIKLIHDERDENVFGHIEFALWSIGPGRPLPALKDSKANLAELVELSKAEDVYVRLYATFTLGYYKPISDQKVIVQALIERIHDQDGVVRWVALKGLHRLGPTAREAVPVLIEVLQIDNKVSQVQAIIALGAIGPDAVAAVPALLNQLYNAHYSVSMFAANSLGRIGPVILPLLETELKTHPFQILEVVRHLGPSGVPVVIKALRMPNKYVRKEAISIAGTLGEAGEATVPLLAAALKDKDDVNRSAAARALGYLGPVSRTTVPALMAALGDKNSWVQCAVATSLGSIGPDAKSAVPDLVRLMNLPLNAQNDVPQRCAAEGLMKMSPETRALVSADMIKRVEDENARILATSSLFAPDETRPKPKPKPKSNKKPAEIY